MSQVEHLTDTQKLDQLLTGFGYLQTQYKEIKMDHDVLREECRILRDENKNLKEALSQMNSGSGRDFLKCETLLQEISELQEAITFSQHELEEYKRTLEERNADLESALNDLTLERAKKCTCFVCRFSQYFGMRRKCL